MNTILFPNADSILRTRRTMRGVTSSAARRGVSWLTLVCLLVLLLPISSALAADELGPMRLGLPGLWNAITSPEFSDAPLRFGVYARRGNIDDGHGFVDPTFLPGVTSEEFRLQLAVRVAHLAILSDSLLTASPIPGHTAEQSRTALTALFGSAGYLVHFEPDP